MTQRSTLVVGTSLAPQSDAVIRAALTLSRSHDADLVLVHGFPVPVVYGGGVYGAGTIQTQIEADTRRYRLEIERQLDRIGVGTDAFEEIVVEMSAGHRLIADIAAGKDADLILVGAHEAQGPLAGFLGSTSDRLLRHTNRPVLIVRGEFTPPASVLAPVDLSPLSESAVSRGLELIDRLSESPPSVDALFVLSRLDREGSAHFQPAQVDRFAMEELEAFLGRLPEQSDRAITPILRCGHPREEILSYQGAHPADLVLLGTHGRSGFEKFLLGSIASEVLRRVETHALVIPPIVDPAEAHSEPAQVVPETVETP